MMIISHADRTVSYDSIKTTSLSDAWYHNIVQFSVKRLKNRVVRAWFVIWYLLCLMEEMMCDMRTGWLISSMTKTMPKNVYVCCHHKDTEQYIDMIIMLRSSLAVGSWEYWSGSGSGSDDASKMFDSSQERKELWNKNESKGKDVSRFTTCNNVYTRYHIIIIISAIIPIGCCSWNHENHSKVVVSFLLLVGCRCA